MSLDITLTAVRPTTVFAYNVTHNLGPMAKKAGLYEALWRPEDLGITKADTLITVLTTGLQNLLSDPASFKALNPSNGWGDYDGLVKFVSEYLQACLENPEATVSAER